jgi:hypothetical protein
VVGHGSADLCERAVGAALEAAPQISDPVSRSSVLALLIEKVSAERRPEVVGMFVESVRCITAPHDRAFALGSLGQGIFTLYRSQLFPIVQETLRALGEKERPSVLLAIAELLPGLAAMNPSSCGRFVSAIGDILRWWP